MMAKNSIDFIIGVSFFNINNLLINKGYVKKGVHVNVQQSTVCMKKV